MADDIQVTPGSGPPVRVFEDGAGKYWPGGVMCYATTISAGANVLQPVMPGFPMPVNVVSGSVGNAAASATGAAVPAQAGYNGVNIAGNLRGLTGVNPSGSVYAAQTDVTSVGGATFALGQQLAALSLPVVLTAAQLSTLTPLSTVAVTGTFWQATQPVSIATLPALAAGTSTVGGVNLVPAAAGGTTAYGRVSTADTNAANVKASAGVLYGYQLFNNHASNWAYLKLYNTAGTPTAGSGTPVKRIGIPPGGGANLQLPYPVAFGTGIGITVTGGAADADTTALAASQVLVNLDYV